MKNKELARIFYAIANILDVQNVQFKPFAYRKAAQSIESLGEDIKEVMEHDELEDIPGIGKNLSEKIREFLKTGKIKTYERLKKEIPIDFESFESVSGLGPKKIAKLYKELKIKNIKDLEKAIKKGKLKGLEGFGEKTEAEFKESIKRGSRGKRTSIGIALPLAESLIEDLKSKDVEKIEYVGSLIRGKETIGDIDILAISKKPKQIIDKFATLPSVQKVLAKGGTKCSVFLEEGIQADLRVLKKEQYGSAFNYFTGSRDHNIALRKIAIKKGLKLSEYGLFKGKKAVEGADEKNIYKRLGMQWIPPEMRENHGEIELAMKKKLPKLIELSDIKGDCQMHSTFSDGAPLDELADKAKSLGYSYIAVTDHVGSLVIAGAMDLAKARRRNKEIQKLNKISKVKIISGAEVDIDKEGGLKATKKLLDEFDFVLASVHSSFKMGKEEQTARMVKVISHPRVTVIGHPTGRLLPHRPGIELDWNRVFKACKEHDVALEINAHPKRLDIRDVVVRKAIEAGVKLMINTDAHSADGMENMRYGVLTARRGWAQKKDVWNTLSYNEFKKKIR